MPLIEGLGKYLDELSPPGQMANMLNCDIVVSEVKIMLCYFVNFRGNAHYSTAISLQVLH